MAYRVVEVFATMQGEGVLAGTPAIFVRFAACNLWSGHDKDRARDAQRNLAVCPVWCDTDFRNGEPCDAGMVVELMASEMHKHTSEDFPLVVFTGGEPMLQLSVGLLEQVKRRFPNIKVAIETNGTKAIEPELRELIDHVCVSPKTPLQTIRVCEGEELKIIYPAVNPEEFLEIADGFRHLWVSPQARVGPEPGISYIDDHATQQAIDFCLRNPAWRLSTQTHKALGLR